MAAEVVCVSVLTGILDTVLRKNISVEAINQCVDDVVSEEKSQSEIVRQKLCCEVYASSIVDVKLL